MQAMQERQNQKPQAPQLPADASLEAQFEALVDLRVAKIIKIEQHPEAERLYIETLDDGSQRPEDSPRVIVSGLVAHYKPEELLGRNIVLVNNLKPAKLRGVKSEGMLLAASTGEGEAEKLEVLFVDDAVPGERVILSGSTAQAPETAIKADRFFAIPIRAQGGNIMVGEGRLSCNGVALTTTKVPDGSVG